MEIAGRLSVRGVRVPEARNVKSYGAAGDGTTDDYTAIMGAYNDLHSNGGVVYFPAGTYLINSTINVDRDNITFIGEGPGATEIKASGDFEVIYFNGVTEAGTLNRGGAKNITIRGGGKDNTSAHGIRTNFSNRITFSDLVFFGCRYAFYIKDAWQVVIRDCNVYGEGTDQTHIGLYGGISENSANNNAVVVNNFNVQSVASHGVRMETFAGSKFMNCEVGAAGGKGWWFGIPSSGSPYCKFMHIVNCLADTCGEEGWYFDGTNANNNEIKDIQIANLWVGSCTEGIHIENAYNMTIANILVETIDGHGVYVDNSARIDFHGGYLDSYDSNDTDTFSGFYFQDSSKCLVSGCNFVSDHAESAIREAGDSNYNRILGNHTMDGGGINTIGGDTVEDNNIS